VAFFSGTIFSDNATTHRADRVVIFLISPQSGFAPSDPAGFDDIPRLGFMVPDAFTEDPETSQNYQFSHLAPGLEVFVVAVLDTSGDGRYRPEDDWWGYHKLDGELDPVAVTAVPLPVTASDPIPRGNVHITLRAP
jgi:hypothetical protein